MVRLNNSQEMTEDFYLKVAQKEVAGHKTVHKFGAVPAMSQNQSGSIWDIDDTDYPWDVFTSASTLSVACNATENGKELVLQGLDANYQIVTETITLNSAGVTTTNSYIRVYRAYMSSEPNTNNITVSYGATPVLRVLAGKGQTLMAIYTVPAGYDAYMIKGTCSCQQSGDASVDFLVRYFGTSVFRVGHSFEVSGNAPYIHEMSIPFYFPEKTDLDVRAQVRSNNSRVSASYDILLVEN